MTYNLNHLAEHIGTGNAARGFHDRYKSLEMDFHSAGEDVCDHIASKLALIHSEVSEALEELRKNPDPHHTYYREDGKPEGVPFELADTLIRVLDLAWMLSIDIQGAVTEKLSFNGSRPHLHDKVF